MGVVSPADRGEHMRLVNERTALLETPAGMAPLRSRAEIINAGQDAPAQERMMRQAAQGKSAAQRLMWLRREADVMLAAAEDSVACRRGCAHCCHIGVLVPESEARVIAKEIGRPLVNPSPEVTLQVDLHRMDEVKAEMLERQAALSDRHYGSPCTFLVAGECSIYRHRPMACRHLVNVDVDDLLCRLVPGERITVPYLNNTRRQAVHMGIMGPGSRMADLRDWFPKG